MSDEMSLKTVYATLTDMLNACYELKNRGEIFNEDYLVISKTLNEACSNVLMAIKWPGMLSKSNKEGM